MLSYLYKEALVSIMSSVSRFLWSLNRKTLANVFLVCAQHQLDWGDLIQFVSASQSSKVYECLPKVSLRRWERTKCFLHRPGKDLWAQSCNLELLFLETNWPVWSVTSLVSDFFLYLNLFRSFWFRIVFVKDLKVFLEKHYLRKVLVTR